MLRKHIQQNCLIHPTISISIIQIYSSVLAIYGCIQPQVQYNHHRECVGAEKLFDIKQFLPRCSHHTAPAVRMRTGYRMYPQNCNAILKTLLALPAVAFAKRPRMAVLHKKERSESGTAVLTKAHRAFVAGLLARHPHARLAVFRYPQRLCAQHNIGTELRHTLHRTTHQRAKQELALHPPYLSRYSATPSSYVPNTEGYRTTPLKTPRVYLVPPLWEAPDRRAAVTRA